MKFIYCPKCKELRVKPWYSIRAWCSRCRQDAREIRVPRTAMSVVLIALIGIVFTVIYMYTRTDDPILLYAGIVGLIATFIVQGVEMARGERWARARIKATKSDAKGFRKKGWM
ncbi:MAG: hypothetical protein JSV90_01450 [Methanobacteriota archaeon]|nr:MAG: hypothetical protein JSV90_01450 [Euryarchaeota archaeon]